MQATWDGCERATVEISARMVDRRHQRWSNSRQDNRHVERDSAERHSISDSAWNGLPNDKASSRGSRKKQIDNFSWRRIWHHVFLIPADGRELRNVRGDCEENLEKVE